MFPRPEQWYVAIGKALRTHSQEITGEPLPTRWADLILHLDQQERRASRTEQSGAASAEQEDWWRAGG